MPHTTMNSLPKAKLIRTYSKNSTLVAERRQHIVQSVTRILYERGYHRVSMREIAEACDMSVGTLYRYIGSKNDVLYLVIDEFRSSTETFCKQVLGKLCKMTPIQALKWAIGEHCHLADEHRHLLMLGWREIGNLEPEYRQQLLQGEVDIVVAFEDILRKGCQMGQFAVHNPPVVAHNIVVLGELWALRQWFLKGKSSLNEFIDQQVEFVCHGVCRGGDIC
jgi:AcrR family transcriptional regulator